MPEQHHTTQQDQILPRNLRSPQPGGSQGDPGRGAREEIARDVLGLDTLETRSSDALDFTDQAVWTLRAALEAAYAAGAKGNKATCIVPDEE